MLLILILPFSFSYNEMSWSLERKKGLSQFRSYSDIIVLTRACNLICLGLSAGRGKGLSAGRGNLISARRLVFVIVNKKRKKKEKREPS